MKQTYKLLAVIPLGFVLFFTTSSISCFVDVFTDDRWDMKLAAFGVGWLDGCAAIVCLVFIWAICKDKI